MVRCFFKMVRFLNQIPRCVSKHPNRRGNVRGPSYTESHSTGGGGGPLLLTAGGKTLSRMVGYASYGRFLAVVFSWVWRFEGFANWEASQFTVMLFDFGNHCIGTQVKLRVGVRILRQSAMIGCQVLGSHPPEDAVLAYSRYMFIIIFPNHHFCSYIPKSPKVYNMYMSNMHMLIVTNPIVQ